MNWLLTSRNKEQILGMQDLIALYEKGKISLSALVDGLTSKLNGMADMEPDWLKNYESLWLDLEICNALCLNDKEQGQQIDRSDHIKKRS